MRAAVCNAYGPPTSLQICDVPDPVAGPGEVVVDIAYGAVNFPDVLLIANRYQVSAPLPFIPGSEFAGSVSQRSVDHQSTVSPGLTRARGARQRRGRHARLNA